MVRKLVSAEAVEDAVYAAGATGYLVGFVIAVEVALSRLVY
jgi:hypothetical protein